MAASVRWVQYDPTTSGYVGTGGSANGKGTLGYSIGSADPGDTVTIGSTTNRFYFNLDGDASPPASYVTVVSGSAMDPRFVAKDITEKIQALSTDDRYANAHCKWENITTATGTYTKRNRFKLYSGTLGSSSSATVTSGTNSSHSVLGWNSKIETGGSANPDGKAAYTFSGDISVRGSYYGLFNEVYKVVISNDNDETRGIAAPSVGGSNTYAGTITTGGVFNHTVDVTYTLEIDVTNGTTMGGGTGNVPRMRWSGSPSDSQTDWVELLYPDYWYNVGTHGLRVKFTDAVFNTCNPAWTIACHKPDYAQGTNANAAVGTAQYVYSSDRGDDSSAPTTTSSGSYTKLGSRGLGIKFNPSGGGDNLGAGDTFYVLCAGVAPYARDISSLNYGNVTVSTESPVKCVMFEVTAGAAELSSVKFGLQNNGSFSHHEAGDSDTYFRFGTVGPANNASVTIGSDTFNAIEWYPNVTAADIDNDVSPDYLYATDDNLPVVATADNSKSIGDYAISGLTADPVWINIRLGASETGANSTINYRAYFDYQ